jgi:GT2 family glycosyltransferase
MSTPLVSIVITTRNRLEPLRRALASAVSQRGVACEVLVVDDASTDGTAAMVRREFPPVRLEVSPVRRGYIVQRNRAAQLARGAAILTIDDDAVLSTDSVAREALAGLDHPRVGAVAIPAFNLNAQDPSQPGMRWFAPPPDPAGVYVTPEYYGCASLLRRDLFQHLGGYREYLFHWGEETDYCTRLWAAGYVVRLASCPPIHHFPAGGSGVRHVSFIPRNRLLMLWYHCPLLLLPGLAGRELAVAVYGARRGGLRGLEQGVWGLARSVPACLHEFRARRPLTVGAYRLLRTLRRTRSNAAPAALAEVQALLPPMRFGPLPAPSAVPQPA